MNGAEHYREAERLLELSQYPARVITGIAPTEAAADEIRGHFGVGTVVLAEPLEYHDQTLAAAQVHATLALAAATAYPAIVSHCGDESGDARRWAQVTS